MYRSRCWTLRMVLLLVGGLFILTTLVTSGWAAAAKKEGPVMNKVSIKQDPGKIVYWVLPGKRELSPTVFGTPENPKTTLREKLAQVGPPWTPPKIIDPVKQLLRDLPPLVAAPMEARGVSQDGSHFTTLNVPTLFSDRAIPLPLKESKEEGHWFNTTLIDRVREDQKGPPGKTPDQAMFEAEFSDPQGNRYRIELDHVVQPPLPGYRTQGGVFVDDYMHGNTGTGSPLMPKQYAWGAWWGVSHVWINGEKLDGFRVTHLMTTEVVRDRDYNLALDEEMPLAPKDRHIKTQSHHTHVVVLPIKPPPPTFNPNVTEFELENGKTQPFMHIMFEQDEITEWKRNLQSWYPGKK